MYKLLTHAYAGKFILLLVISNYLHLKLQLQLTTPGMLVYMENN